VLVIRVRKEFEDSWGDVALGLAEVIVRQKVSVG
jgi:hypothetical protein